MQVSHREVIKGDGPEHRNSHAPHDHAPWAERRELKDAFVDEPAHEAQCPNDTRIEQDPKPARESCTSQDTDADRDRCDESAQAENRVREAKDRTLHRLQILSALHKDAEVASEVRGRVLQRLKLGHRQFPRRIYPYGASDDQEPGEDYRASGLGGAHHTRDYRTRKNRVCSNGVR